MNLTPFGREVRKARLDARCTLSELSADLEISNGFLSSMETGRAKVRRETCNRVEAALIKRGAPLKPGSLWPYAEISNGSVSVATLSDMQALLVARLARAKLNLEQLTALQSVLNCNV